jgi:hypothetical protein
MSLWTCPNCEADQINSIYEYRRVYNYTSTLHEKGGVIADQLIGNGIYRETVEDTSSSEDDMRKETDYEVCKRWLMQDRPSGEDAQIGDTDGPAYICSNCLNTFTSLEIP